MRPNKINSLSRQLTLGKPAFLSRIFEILDSGDSTKGLIIAVSLLEQRSFLYFNKSFKKLLGVKVDNLLKQGWDFWYSNICPQEALMVKNRVKNFFSQPFDRKPITLKYHMYDGDKNLICVRHEIVLHKLENCMMAINYFFDISEKEQIENCLQLRNGEDLLNENNGIKLISPREEEVLKLVADGHSSKQIADMLFISNHTAISHRKHLIEKFQVKNTAQLIKKASKIMEL